MFVVFLRRRSNHAPNIQHAAGRQDDELILGDQMDQHTVSDITGDLLNEQSPSGQDFTPDYAAEITDILLDDGDSYGLLPIDPVQNEAYGDPVGYAILGLVPDLPHYEAGQDNNSFLSELEHGFSDLGQEDSYVSDLGQGSSYVSDLYTTNTPDYSGPVCI
jgi:hypothetical protein